MTTGGPAAGSAASRLVLPLGLSLLAWRARGRERALRARLATVEAAEQRLRSVAEAAPVGVFALDDAGRAVYANPRLRELLGPLPHRLTDLSRVAPDDREAVRRSWRHSRRTGQPHTGSYRVLDREGRTRWVKEVTTRLPDGSGWVGTVTDVTEEVAALGEAGRLSEVLAASPDWVVIVDAAGRFLWANDAVRRHWRRRPEELLRPDPLRLLRRESRVTVVREALPAAAATGTWRGELTLLGPLGEELPVSLVLVAHRGDGGAVERWSCVVRNLSERHAYEARLLHRGMHDPLTGLPNRALLLDRLAHGLGRAERDGSTVAVLVLDVDDFGAVNHSQGHDAGDALLVLAAARLSEAVRPGDTAAHLGADEFVVLCEDIGDAEAASELADHLAGVLSEPYALADATVRVTVSAGVALGRGTGLTPHVLLADAGAALQRAKQRGHGHRELFAEELRADVAQRLRTASDLYRALHRGEFRLVYQPEVDLDTRRFVAAEALLRWEHPERGLVPPGEFVPLAEETGLVVELGAWVLDAAAAQAAVWRREGAGGAGVPVWVNLSTRQLADPGLLAVVREVVARHAVRPGELGLEITETAVLEDTAASVATLRELKTLGLRVAVDDFGTGYSSLSHLKQLPLDLVKVDRTFVDGLGRDPDDTAIVGAVLGMTRALGLATVAEGVETPQQAAALVELGCSLAQGYHFLPPRPPEEVGALLRAQREAART